MKFFNRDPVTFTDDGKPFTDDGKPFTFHFLAPLTFLICWSWPICEHGGSTHAGPLMMKDFYSIVPYCLLRLLN